MTIIETTLLVIACGVVIFLGYVIFLAIYKLGLRRGRFQVAGLFARITEDYCEAHPVPETVYDQTILKAQLDALIEVMERLAVKTYKLSGPKRKAVEHAKVQKG